MKRNILLTMLAAGLLLTHTACEDNKDEYLSDFSTILYFRDSGEIAVTTYITGNNEPYTLTVDKAGSDLGATASVDVNIMSDAALQAYNTERGYNYRAYPASCYTFAGETLQFGSADLYKQVNIEMNPAEMANYYDAASSEVYVIPLELNNGTDSINSDKRYVFLRATPQYPEISFNPYGYNSTVISDDGTATATLSYNVTIPIANEWGIQCDVEVDPALLDAYNLANGTSYALMDEANYTLNGSIAFDEGATTAPLSITVNKENLAYGDYVIPLKITNASNSYFLTDGESSQLLAGVSFTLPEIALTAAMLSSNHVEPSEGSLANLLDGDISTYFHSTWSQATTDEHYVQVALSSPISVLSFSYTTRDANGNANPAEMYVSVSADGQEWTEVARFTTAEDNLPTGAAASWTSPRIDCGGISAMYVRFTNVTTVTNNPYFVWSEFSLRGR